MNVAPIAEARRRNTNLVASLSTFVGRGALLLEIESAFRAARLVVLMGPPGVGKTRVATRFADLHGDTFRKRGGVWLCDLSSCRTAGDMLRTVAKSLGLRTPANLEPATLLGQVSETLAERGDLLLVADNFEQLEDEAAGALAALLGTAEGCRALVTSRRRLAVDGERIVEVRPLALAHTTHEGGRSDAAELFVARAVALGTPRESLDDAQVAALVLELEGMPLAIELAAARCRVLGVAQLRAALRASHLILSPNRSGSSSLERAVERSFALLAPSDAATLMQCSVFRGPFSLEAAEAVVRLDDTTDVLEHLSTLRDQSLLVHDSSTESAASFALYASLRDFAARQLERAQGTAAAEERHTRYFVERGVGIALRHAISGSAAERQQLEAARQDLRAIFDRLGAEAQGPERQRDLARCVFAMEAVLGASADAAQISTTLTAGLEAGRAAGDAESLELVARLLVARGVAYGIRGDAANALLDLGHAEELAQGMGLTPVVAEARVHRGVRLRQRGLVHEAVDLVTAAAELVQGGTAPRVEGAARVVLGMLLGELGRHTEARVENERALAIFSLAGDTWSEALALANLAQLDQARGDFDAAARGFDAAIERFRTFGDRPYLGRYSGYQAALAHERGDLDGAVVGYRMALDILGSLDAPHAEGLVWACLGAASAGRDDLVDASFALERAALLLERVEAPLARAALELHRGHLELARARADARSDETEREREGERLVATARARLFAVTHAESSEDVRFAVRLLERAITSCHAPKAARPTRGPLVIGPRALWFRLGEAPAVDLTRRASLSRLVDHLARERLTNPGRTSSWTVLLAAGWPDERVLAMAGATRVRVAVATLRKLGLADVLETRGDGYLFADQVAVRREV